MNKPAVWHVLGAGSMGCLWAARLREAGHAVTLIARNVPEPAVQTLTLESAEGSRQWPLTCIAAEHCGAISHLMLATKAQDAEVALASVADSITASTHILLLQNGLRVQHRLTELYPGQVFCLSNSHGAWMRAPLHVVHAGRGQAWLGRLHGIAEELSVPEELNSLLQELPIESMRIQIDLRIARRLWSKFAINCAINALTVIHDCPNGELLENPAIRQQLVSICEEIELILAATPGAPAMPDLLPSVDEVLADTAENFSSTLQDVRRGRPTELTELNGYLCELAREAGCSCAVNEWLLNSVQALVPPE